MSQLAYVSATDLAKRWDRCKATVVRWCRDGLIPGACKLGCDHFPRWYIPLSWVAEGERKTVKQVRTEIQDSIRERKKKTWENVKERVRKGKART